MFPLKDNLRCLTFPTVTLSLIIVNILVFVLELTHQSNGTFRQFIMDYALVPTSLINAYSSGDPSAIGWTTFTMFSAMFMHGSIMHLLGNMLFLFVFGRAMEARMGWFGFLVFYLVSGVAAALIHIGSDPTSFVPMLGASGAISGVLGGYLILWPKAEIKAFVPPLFIVTIRAYWFLAVWFGLQLYPVLMTNGGSPGGVAYWAHIGGFVAGFIIAGVLRLYRPVSDVCYIPSDCDTDKDIDEWKGRL